MNVKELIDVLSQFPADMEVRYEYDGGHSYPTFCHAEIKAVDREPESFVCLFEHDGWAGELVKCENCGQGV